MVVPRREVRIVGEIDESRTVTLRGNTHPLATAVNDRGAVSLAQAMQRMLLLLRRSPEQDAALEKLLADQQRPDSPLFHQWLTPEQFGANYGPTTQDVQTVMAWLVSRGFRGVKPNQGRTVIEFSGTADQVQAAFHTSIHRYQASGSLHIANERDPSIPAALFPVVRGIVSLNDFRPRSMAIRGPTGKMTNGQFRSQAAEPQFTLPEPANVATYYWLSPYDFATIYDLLPLWNAGFDGTGQTIAIVGETNINLTDAAQFRALFGLPANTPTVVLAGADPGVQQDEIESDLDVEWSGAVAKGAKIELVSAASTETTPGADLAALYVIDNNLAPVMSESYGECEMFLGTTGNAFEAAMWQQAAAEGITVLISSGDQGSAVCDAGQEMSNHAMAVNGLASTPYNLAVGGTDFNQKDNWATYWNSTNDPVTKQSVLGYIPEVPWNDSCGSTLLATLNGGDPSNWCGNTGLDYEDTIATSGGPSSCISSNGTDLSSCAGGWPKPAWQKGTGVPADGVRDVPDVSFFASNNVYRSMYVTCQVDLSFPPGCDPNAATQTYLGLGGTSASTPAMAGVMAIINQKYGRQGNANYTLYRLSAGANAASIFHDITTDGNRVTCLSSSPDCEIDPTAEFPFGRLKGHDSTIGYDMVTGWGSVDIANLVNNWNSVAFASSKTLLNLNGGTTTVSANHGTAINASVNVTATSGTPTGDVSLIGTAANGSIDLGTLHSGSVSGSIASLPGGSYAVTAHYGGDAQFGASDSTPVNVSISPESSATTVSFFNYDRTTSAFLPSPASVPYGSLILLRADVKGASGFGSATGTATLNDGSSSLGSLALNAQAYTETAPNNLLLGGAHGIVASYSGDSSFNASKSATMSIAVTPAPMTCNLATNTVYMRPGWTLTAVPQAWIYQPQVEVPLGSMVAPTGTLNIYAASSMVSGPSIGTGHASGFLGGGAFVIPGIAADPVTLPATDFSASMSVTMSYSGDSNYAACTSPPLQITYDSSPMVPQMSLVPSQYQNILQGTAVPATATVNSSLFPVIYEPPFPVATGTYQLAVDGVLMGSPLPLVPGTSLYGIPSGIVSFSIPTAGLAPGMHTLTQNYSGDSSYQPAQYPGPSIWVVIPDFSVTESSNNLTVTNGQTTGPITMQVSALNGFTGTVSFSCSGLPADSACVFSPSTVAGSGGTTLTITTTQAQFVTGGETARSHGGRFNWKAGLGGFSAALVVVFIVPKRRRYLGLVIIATTTMIFGVMSCGGGSGSGNSQSSPIATSIYLSATTNTPSKGITDTFTATVTPTGSILTPTGTVQFSVDGAASGSPVTMSQGTAKFQTSFATAGMHKVAASYSGDGSNLSSTSSPFTVNVPYTSGTAPGNYGIAISATSGGLSHIVYLNLQVK